MFSDLTFEGYLAGSTPDPPFEGVFCIFLFSGTGCSSVRVVHLTGEYFGIIILKKDVFFFFFFLVKKILSLKEKNKLAKIS